MPSSSDMTDTASNNATPVVALEDLSDLTGKPPADKKLTYFNVRDSMTSLVALKEYDRYVTEHRKRLRQLYREARGILAPSEESYR